ncbi:unnamed protein product [Coffea canephora]|uniref:Uncharacterized protein n=1 Tax=Coffea canephora TaxID=49390 RepID=A0A068UWJ4_COFCA|nr:unnamed protein product [Coffea canephora]
MIIHNNPKRQKNNLYLYLTDDYCSNTSSSNMSNKQSCFPKPLSHGFIKLERINIQIPGHNTLF